MKTLDPPSPVVQSRLRRLRRDELERLCVALAEDLRNTTSIDDWDAERPVDTAEEASRLGYQSLAMAIDPTHDYVGDVLRSNA